MDPVAGASGAIDLHTHVLPGMDDGSDCVEVSLALLRQLSEQGVQTVCCTSHYYAHREPAVHFCERRQAALARLEAVLPPGMPTLVPGAETAWFPQISTQDLTSLCLQGTCTLLLEMPFVRWNQQEIDEVISLVLDRGYQVILVHPERFCFDNANRRWIEKLSELPVALQVNAETLVRWQTRKQGLELLNLARYPLLGSDCHNLDQRPPRIEQARRVILKKLGAEFLRQMDWDAQSAVDGTGWND